MPGQRPSRAVMAGVPFGRRGTSVIGACPHAGSEHCVQRARSRLRKWTKRKVRWVLLTATVTATTAPTDNQGQLCTASYSRTFCLSWASATPEAEVRRATPRCRAWSSSGRPLADSVPCRLAGVSDSGSKMGATARGPVRLDAVSRAACSALSRIDTSEQPACTRARAVRDEEAAGSNPATPTGKRQVTRYLVLQP
jgi:hypothetical protein